MPYTIVTACRVGSLHDNTTGHACACRLGFKRHHHGNMHPFSQDVKNEGAKSNARVARENLERNLRPLIKSRLLGLSHVQTKRLNGVLVWCLSTEKVMLKRLGSYSLIETPGTNLVSLASRIFSVRACAYNEVGGERKEKCVW